MFSSRVAIVLGNSDSTHWGHSIRDQYVYGVFEVFDQNGKAASIGESIVRPFSLGIGSTQSAREKVLAFVKNSTEVSLTTFIGIVPDSHVVHVTLFGKGRVYLYRNRKLVCLMYRSGSLSGNILDGDIFFCVSHRLVSIFTQEYMEQQLLSGDIEDIANRLTLFLNAHQGAEGGAALLYQAKNNIETTATVDPVYNEKSVDALQIKKRLSFGKRFHILGSFPARFWKKTVNPQGTGHKKAIIFIVTLLLVGVFLTSVVLGITKQLKTGNNSALVSAVEEASHAFDEGVALSQLNPIKSRERLVQAKNALAPFIETLSNRSKDERDAQALYKEIQDNLTQSLQKISVEPSLFYEVDLLKKGSTIDRMTNEGDVLGLIDGHTSTVYSLGISDKNGQIVGGESVSGLRLVGIHGAIVFFTSSDGIDRIDTEQKKLTKAIVSPDPSWGTLSSLVSFGGNLYLLDTQKSRIWKYIATDTGFSEIREYLNPDTLPDLSHATDMVIDGSVWIGTTDGRILKFSQGHEDTFVPEGVDPPFGKSLMVYTSEETKNLYVLDQDQKRVVVLDKDGMYLAQYEWQGSLKPTQMVVSETQKKIILLIGGKLYTIDLR